MVKKIHLMVNTELTQVRLYLESPMFSLSEWVIWFSVVELSHEIVKSSF